MIYEGSLRIDGPGGTAVTELKPHEVCHILMGQYVDYTTESSDYTVEIYKRGNNKPIC